MTPSRSKYRSDFHERRKFNLDKFRTWIRLNPSELREVAQEFARKLNLSTAPVKLMIPKKGWSSVDSEGSPTYDPAEDQVFVETLTALLNPGVEIIEVDANMEDTAFSKAVADLALTLF
jgi:uncharacterized protein (UPF0261 family)